MSIIIGRDIFSSTWLQTVTELRSFSETRGKRWKVKKIILLLV
jgi:hypothetical protein